MRDIDGGQSVQGSLAALHHSHLCTELQPPGKEAAPGSCCPGLGLDVTPVFLQPRFPQA